ncbi:tyrosine-type recombinase/integrase [Sideroxydans sp.]
MSLTDIKIRHAKPEAKTVRMFDGKGLYLELSPSGGKWWRLKYRFLDKEKRISLGTYPEVTLADAREKTLELRKLLAQGVDPGEQRKAAKIAAIESVTNSYEAIAREWFAKFSRDWTPSHSIKIIQRMERDIFPWMGARPIAEINAPELLRVLRKIEDRGALETAHRALANVSQIFSYAIATGRADRNPAPDLRGALPPYRRDRHMAAVTSPARIGELMRSIDGYTGSMVVRCALQLSPYVFLRPGELRMAAWYEIDLDNALWTIPAERMKMRQPHVVPLSKQAIAILREVYPLTSREKYVFPGERDRDRPMSDNAVRSALRRLGWSNDEMTPHGFRAMASTTLDNLGFDPKLIERQLAHEEPNKVKAAYKRETWLMYLPDRANMMQAWADYLDSLKSGAKVIPLKA